MTETRRKRLALILLLLLGVGGATAVALFGLGEQINTFFSPSDVAAGKATNHVRVRVGGVVKEDSVRRQADNLEMSFKITDRRHCLTVHFNKLLPDLFRQGDSVIVTGRLQPDGSVQADEVLAKHDEKYMPPEVQKAMAAAKTEAEKAKQQNMQDCAP